jgi:hypothetical protein
MKQHERHADDVQKQQQNQQRKVVEMNDQHPVNTLA